ncbi:hypothetical protein HYPSUDRAFT_134612 [Hypholoma sublateritium FD-334 SS-4]|uniref:G-protein coupled receptors family 1 profile domain-containing protein n=1 Tax=Hypholoma sublateritium (strain FD-334 SS-4) TaxID=945553 RepID=A0A0D2Q227_HYPSF|nr:hypothetical protein HYPSUDRAFT_134612 [Hypholoma sublateritium FD-334 SS-4]
MANPGAIPLQLPNPDTPLAFLTPEEAYQASVSNYVLAGTSAVLVWDVLDNVSIDFGIVFRSRFTLSTAAFVVSRLATLALAITLDIFSTAPTGNCVNFHTLSTAFYPISVGCSALLFFFRLRAIYNRDRIVVGFFFILWCGLVTCTSFIPANVIGGALGPTKYCTSVNNKSVQLSFAGVIAPLVNDTLIFCAISWRLVQNAYIEGNLGQNVKVAMFGTYLPTFSKGLLLDGQRYYLITLISNLIAVVIAFDTSVPPEMRSIFSQPNIVLTNIMACRVYRRIRRGIFREAAVSTTALAVKQPRKPSGVDAVYVSSIMMTAGPSFCVDIEGNSRAEYSHPASESQQSTDGIEQHGGGASTHTI